MKYRRNLPQLAGNIFLTDGGLETTLVFLDGIDLPEFAAIDQVRTDEGRERLRRYFEPYLALAQRYRTGFILESPTWRGNPDWAPLLQYSLDEMDAYNRRSIELMLELRGDFETDECPIVVSGCVGPRSDGYSHKMVMTASEARAYHQRQIDVFEAAGADCVSAITMTYPDEAVGIALAAERAGIPSIISFTVETDGRLISGESLEQAIGRVDDATAAAPAYYMINCAHPSHFEDALDGEWTHRIGGIRANASRCSHAELDEAEELDWGNPDELGDDYRRLVASLPNVSVLGGCCGTDIRHIKSIAERLAA